LITGRRGNSLSAGDDNEIAYVACELGLGIGVFPQLRLTHLIPKERLTRKYLLKLVEAAEASDALLQYKWKGSFPRSPFSPSGIIGILKNIIAGRGSDRRAYIAYVRGLIAARRIIADTRAKRSVQAS
jgi:hypothetical protein